VEANPMNFQSIKRFNWLIVALPCAFIAAPSNVNSQADDAVKVRWDSSNLPPDAVFLPKFIEHITGVALAQPSRERQIAYIGTNLGLDDTVSQEAEDYLSLFVEIRDDTRTGKSDFFRDNLCPIDSERPTGVEFLERLDIADEHGDLLGAEGIARIRTSMEPKVLESFMSWMHKVMKNSTTIRLDHKIAYANKNLSIVTQDICGRFDSNIANQ
jgi:hypothetical protein